MRIVDTYPSRAPTEVCWEEMDRSDHSVQIYSDTQSFLEALEGFVSGGLRAGESVIVIATEIHRRALDRMLARRGYDLGQAKQESRYLVIDAAEALDKFMVDGWPDSDKFRIFVKDIFTRATAKGRPVRAFGEMVALLWEQGNSASTMQLETLWNQFCDKEGLRLFCAYPRSGFTEDALDSIGTICAHHSRVIPE